MIELLDDLEDDESRKVRYEGHQRANDLLVRHSDRVERLANALLAKKRLGRDELRNILDASWSSEERGRINA